MGVEEHPHDDALVVAAFQDLTRSLNEQRSSPAVETILFLNLGDVRDNSAIISRRKLLNGISDSIFGSTREIALVSERSIEV